MSNIFLLLSYLLHSKNNFDKCLVPHKSPIPWIYDGTHRFVTTGTSSVLLKMQATKKQAFPTKNRLPADKFLPASDFYFFN